MSQVEKLLKYQEEDAKLRKIEQEDAASEERKNFMQAKAFLTKASDKLDAFDAKAQQLAALLPELKAKYEEVAETLVDFENLDELVEDGADISFYKKSLAQLTEKVKSLRAEIAALTKAIKDSDEEYRAMKKKTIAVQNQYAEYSETYKNFRNKKREEMATVKRELDEIAKDIDPAVFQRYQNKRSEHIFPVLCAVKDNRCTKCGYELSLVGKEKISMGAAVECENCHRFLYKG